MNCNVNSILFPYIILYDLICNIILYELIYNIISYNIDENS